ncbi:MAG TPA: Gfo/Idh/MocA family oxidoreductase [Ktedonobacterales bacterium]|nr:Gfo/Idh/MocA family oxidoreductase [Ktedonobacterales bacterium]
MNAQLRFGLIGWGYWGPKIARNISSMRHADLTFICDMDENRIAQVAMDYPLARVSARPEELFAADLDCVVIATPVRTHFDLARQALLSGKHVMVEKPLTASVAEAEELVALAKRANKVLMVGHTFEYSPAVNELRSLVTNGQIGRIFCIETERLNLGLFRNDIDVIWDLAPHDVSILNYVLGVAPTTVRVTAHGHLRSAIADNAHIDLGYDDGATAHVHVSWMHPTKVRRVTLIGKDRMAVYDDTSAPQEMLRLFDKGAELGADPVVSYRNGPINIPYLEFAEPLRLECEDFANAVLNGVAPRASGEVGLAVVRILAAAQQSLRSGGAVVSIASEQQPDAQPLAHTTRMNTRPR